MLILRSLIIEIREACSSSNDYNLHEQYNSGSLSVEVLLSLAISPQFTVKNLDQLYVLVYYLSLYEQYSVESDDKTQIN